MNRDVEALGAKVLHQWASLGEYDFVNVVEAPDELDDGEPLAEARRAREREVRDDAALPVDELALEASARRRRPGDASRASLTP